MSELFENNLCLIKTNKYKSINLALDFAVEYDAKTKLALNVLANILGEYSLNYPTKREMTAIKDKLYGANITCDIKYHRNLIFFYVKYNFINPCFLKGVMMTDFINFFKEIMNNILIAEDILNENKKIYKDALKRTLDKPSTLALNRTMEILAKEDRELDIYNVNLLDEIDSLTIDDIRSAYDSLFKGDLKVFLTGNVDDELLTYVKTLSSNTEYKLINKPLDLKDLGSVIEDKDVSQSNLNVIYQTPNNRTNPDFYAYMLGNVLLGGVPTSLLFEEVREKRSLCYYISVTDYKNEGLVRIYTGIDGKNADEVVKQIDIQIKRLIHKDYDPLKLEMARTLLIDSLSSTVDDNDALNDYLHITKLNGLNVSLNEYIDNLEKVTVDDISRVFKNYKHVLTYLLRGVKDE